MGKHLTLEQRAKREALQRLGLTQAAIAAEIGSNQSVVSRELRRNQGGRGYRCQQAQDKATARRSAASLIPRKLDDTMIALLRILALALVLEGRSRTEAASLSGMDRQTLSDWVHRFNALGIDGLKSRKSPGRVPYLTEAQKAELRELVIQGPDPDVHKVVRWRCADLRAEVARRWSVDVHESTIGAWLGRTPPDAAAAASGASEEGSTGRGDF